MKLIKGQMIMFMIVMVTAAMKIDAVHDGVQSGNMTRLVSIQRVKRSGAVIAGLSLGVALVSPLMAVIKQVYSHAKVTFNMQIENRIMLPLKIKILKSKDGDITLPPYDVQGCNMGYVLGKSKIDLSGYVYWYIERKAMHLIVYWEVAINKSNRLSIWTSQVEPEIKYDDDKLEEWIRKDSLSKEFGTKRYGRIMEEVCGNITNGVEVCGTMGTGRKPNIHIQVKSTNDSIRCKEDYEKLA